MNKSKNAEKTEDIWTKLERDPPKLSDEILSNNVMNTILFIGELNTGKSSLIQNFLKPTNSKDVKPTIALEYNYARKTGSSNTKSVANIWELGGDMIENQLIEVVLSAKNFSSTSIVICCDLSKPQNIFRSVKRSISVIKEVINTRTSELQSKQNTMLMNIRDNITNKYNGHPDAKIIKPLEVPIYIVANKFDNYKTLPSSERRAIIQVLRFIAHYYGATLITTSTNDAALRESFRNLFSSICFNGTIKPTNELNIDKFVFVTSGMDTFQSILLDTKSSIEGSDAKMKYLLITQESDVDLFLTKKGLTKDCWNRMADHMVSLFGEPDPLNTNPNMKDKKELESGMDPTDQGEALNPFPEPEIDELRSVRDVAMMRYRQDMERREEMLTKMNNNNK